MPDDTKKNNNDDMLAKLPIEFYAGVEHDLRGVINALDGWVSLLVDQDAEAFHDEARQQVQANVEALIALVQRMKTYKDHYRAQQETPAPGKD